jgi:hypothetical protein
MHDVKNLAALVLVWLVHVTASTCVSTAACIPVDHSLANMLTAC